MRKLKFRMVQRMIFIIVCAFTLASQHAYSIGNENAISRGAASTRLGNASLTLIDSWACLNNQGALAFLSDPVVGLSYENRYSLKELSVRSLVAAHPLGGGVFSAQLSSYGGELFAVYKFGGGYSRKFGEQVGVGLHFDVLSIKMNPHVRSEYVATFELGFLFLVNDRARVGFHLFNPGSVSFKLETYNEYLPVEYRLGGSYQMSTKIDVMYELAGNNEVAPFGRVGFNYHLGSTLQVSLGFQTLGASLGGGLEYSISNVRMNFACRSTQNLGRIYSISASYYFK